MYLIIKRDDGGVSFGQLSDTLTAAQVQVEVDKWAALGNRTVISHRTTDISNLPNKIVNTVTVLDKEFRDTWTDDNPGDTVDVVLTDAKILQENRIRAARDAKWPDFDRRYLAVQRDVGDLTALDVERQTLKDIPNNAQIDIDAAVDVAALKAAWPVELT